jgi:glutaredoxin 3
MSSVEIYTRQYCSYCHAAKDLLNRKGVVFREFDITTHPEQRQEMIERTKGQMTYPQIFIGTTYVGGCDDLYALDDAGKLDALLQQGQDGAA